MLIVVLTNKYKWFYQMKLIFHSNSNYKSFYKSMN